MRANKVIVVVFVVFVVVLYDWKLSSVIHGFEKVTSIL